MITIQQREDKFIMCKQTAFIICINAKPGINSISNIMAIKADTEYIIPELKFWMLCHGNSCTTHENRI